MDDVTFKVWNLPSYSMSKEDFKKCIDEEYEEYELDDLIDVLKDEVENYHFRVHKETKYVIFGDIDGYDNGIKRFKVLFINFMKECYDIQLIASDIKYTQNKSKVGSYHFSIPKYYCTSDRMKNIMKNFIVKSSEFGKGVIDTSVYSEKWFRYPNQMKKNEQGTEHIIIEGEMENFIVEHIPSDSIDIENKKFIEANQPKWKKKVKKKKDNIIVEEGESDEDTSLSEEDEQQVTKIEKKLHKSKNYYYYHTYRLFFDKCFNDSRFDNYNNWITVGMALMNIYGMDAFDLFDYFSSKSKKYVGREETFAKYKSFKENYEFGYKISKIYEFARSDNIKQYIKIMSKTEFTFHTDDVAEKIKELAGDRFIYQVKGKDKKTNFILYCYNGKFWESNNVQFRKFLSNELYHYYKNLIFDLYGDKTTEYVKNKKLVDKLRTVSFKKDIMTAYEVIGINDNIKFDEKWWLLGFKNVVYDLKVGKFREYMFDDYITMTTRYDWIAPTKEQINRMKKIVGTIMPVEEERNFYLLLLCTTLEGRQLERFIVFNGSGGNGKGLINDLLLLSLGDYGILGNNSILFEKSKTSVNPEKANLHKKRVVIFREPPQREKFQNSPLKELTGGGEFSARGLYEDDAQKTLHSTTICECNKRPLLAEDVTNGDIRRFIDVLFRSVFTDDHELIDEEHYIFEGKTEYKEREFQEEHKFALLQILFDVHKIYTKNEFKLMTPKSVRDRTKEYLESSCDLLGWFNENYEKTNDKKDIIKLKDVFNEFKRSDLKNSMTKAEQRRYNYKYMCEFFQQNPFMKNFYYNVYKPSKNKCYTNILIGWEEKEIEEDSNEGSDSSDDDESIENPLD